MTFCRLHMTWRCSQEHTAAIATIPSYNKTRKWEGLSGKKKGSSGVEGGIREGMEGLGS